MLTRKTPETLATEVTVKGQGETVTFEVTFYNRKLREIKAFVDQLSPAPDDDLEFNNRETLLYMVKSWNTEYPLNNEGVREMEDSRPGMIINLFNFYHQARAVELVKN